MKQDLGTRILCSSLEAYKQGAKLHRPEGQTSKATLRLSNRRSAHLLEIGNLEFVECSSGIWAQEFLALVWGLTNRRQNCTDLKARPERRR